MSHFSNNFPDSQRVETAKRAEPSKRLLGVAERNKDTEYLCGTTEFDPSYAESTLATGGHIPVSRN